MKENKDSIKEAFRKVKEDINSIKEEINSMNTFYQEVFHLRFLTSELKKELISLCDILHTLVKKVDDLSSKEQIIKDISPDKPTNNKIIQTNVPNIPTQNTTNKALKDINQGISIGNDGVPTDQQTDQQTNRQIKNLLQPPPQTPRNIDISEILSSLDSIKRELRLKLKRLTDQEFLVLSTIYQLEEEGCFIDYKTLSSKLNLSESSIRDYIGKLIKKGIPLDKVKVNNKSIQLTLSNNLKKMASLHTLLELRDL